MLRLGMVREHLTLDRPDDFNAFLTEFQRETDRAAAVLAAAYLDDLLRQLILAALVDQTKQVTRLLETDRPLGSFGARILASRAFGLIDESERFDLDQIRTVRNKFAHRLHGMTFDDDSIAAKCRTFKLNEETFTRLPEFARVHPRGSRQLFDLAAALLAHSLHTRLSRRQRFGVEPRLPGHRKAVV